MKNILLYIICTMLFIACGPDQEKVEGTYSILNESNVEVVLKFPRVNRDDLVFTLEPQTSIIGERLELSNGGPFSNPEAVTPSTSFGTDDIALLYFDNVAQTSYTINSIEGMINFTPPINLNIFRNGNYTNIGARIFEYTITQADVNMATPCDGPCE